MMNCGRDYDAPPPSLHPSLPQVWDSSTGMVLADFKGHNNIVTCCALSRSGKLVVSGSEDCTLKVRGGEGEEVLGSERISN